MSKKKTKEEYIEQLSVKNPKLELLGDYVDNHTKTLHRCLIHNITWEIDPNHALRGHGCSECALEGQRTKRRKSEEQYINELVIKNPTVKLIGKYINGKTLTEHYCEIHKIFFNIRPDSALQGKGCKHCKSDKIRIKLLKNEEDYIQELAEKNPNVKLVGKYLGIDVITEHLCLIHNVVWKTRPHNVLYGKGCSQCLSEKIGNKFKKSDEQYIEELLIKNSDLTFVGPYINYKTPTKHYCKKHQIYFDISPNCALLGHGCSRCTSEKNRENRLKPEEQYVEELKEIHPNIMLRGEYIGGNINTLHECLICGCKWNPKPSNLLTGYGCPECNESKGEKQVKLWLKNNKIDYVPQKQFDGCRGKRALPFDFYLPNCNTCIEYQGKQHYEVVEYFGGEGTLLYTQHHDKIKFDYCTEHNIKLIHIPYWEDVDEYLNKNLLI